MRRRTARHSRSIESQLKLIVFTLEYPLKNPLDSQLEQVSSSIDCAIPMSEVCQVLNKGQHLTEFNADYPQFDLQTHLFGQSLPPERNYTLILEGQTAQNLRWGLHIPTLPTLVYVPNQSVKPFIPEDLQGENQVMPMRSLLNRFVTLTDADSVKTLFLLDLDRLSQMAQPVNRPLV